MQIIVEGWRFIPHSYAIVNQFQCLELMKRPDIDLFHRDAPYYSSHWKLVKGLLPAETEDRLNQLVEAAPAQWSDVLLRLGYPHDFSFSPAKKMAVFVTSELGMVKKVAMARGKTLEEVHSNSDALIVTPSHWSQAGVIRSGADPSRVKVVPHGVETALFHPLSDAERQALRTSLGWDGFVFLNIGTMGGNKGIPLLLKAFVEIAAQYPEARLALKGLDDLYGSKTQITNLHQTLTKEEMRLVQGRLLYLGNTLTFAETAKLYQAADVYVSPYFAEGFNLPVLEAIASGLPVICTSGGATDDFTQPDFALKISSHLQELEITNDHSGYCLVPDFDHLIVLMQTALEQSALRTRARVAGPQFVADRFTWKHAVDNLLSVLSVP